MLVWLTGALAKISSDRFVRFCTAEISVSLLHPYNASDVRFGRFFSAEISEDMSVRLEHKR